MSKTIELIPTDKAKYTIYEWHVNRLLVSRDIAKPYNNLGEFVLPAGINSKADNITIRRRIIKPYSITAAIIESRYL